MSILKNKSAQNTSKSASTNTYFANACSWADDTFGLLEQSRNRYQLAFVLASILNIITVVAVCFLAKVQTLVPMMVHHYEQGVTTVEPLAHAADPLNKAQIESDLVHYVINRESYDASSYHAQFDLVNLLSSDTVSDQYAREQDRHAKDAPIQLLGATHMRDVHVYSINFIDNASLNESKSRENHQNLAEIVFTLTDTDKQSGLKTQHHFNALISWTYVTPSTNPAIRWQNWDGFRVTRYSRQIRNV